MSNTTIPNIQLEGARLIFKNFQGKKTNCNEEGNRNFGVLLPEDLAEELERTGWNVKRLKPREDDPNQYCQPWMSVKVRYGNIPPIAVLINSRGKRPLDEELIGQLDWTMIKNCDLIIRPYQYEMQGKRGVSAYLKAIYVTVQEDEFAEKYANIPDIIDSDPEE